MPRKRRETTEDNNLNAEPGASMATATEPLPANAQEQALPAEGQAQGPEGKNWGPPYKAIFVCPAKGFEMGEDRRFRQRVFKFVEKPDPHVLDTLKANGFTYRANEKSWTIPANAETRLLSDRLTQEFAGEAQGATRG